MSNSNEASKVSGTKLLLDEHPLLVLPNLAKAVGLNESIVIQQVHYWLQKSKHFHDGCFWIYNSYEKWQEQFPFWSERTLRTIISNLEKSGLLISSNYNRLSIDRTKWYTIAYDLLEKIPTPSDKIVRPSGRSCQMDRQNPSDHPATPAAPLPETNDAETTADTTAEREEGPPSLSAAISSHSGGESLKDKTDQKPDNSPSCGVGIGIGKPTPRQINFARSLSAEYNIPLPENYESDLLVCSTFISQARQGMVSDGRGNSYPLKYIMEKYRCSREYAESYARRETDFREIEEEKAAQAAL